MTFYKHCGCRAQKEIKQCQQSTETKNSQKIGKKKISVQKIVNKKERRRDRERQKE